MKALAKTPEERYQSGRELLDDLEKCKENKSSATKPAVPPRAPAALNQAAASAKFTNTVQAKPSPAVAAPRSAKAAEQQEQGGSETNANQATGGSHVAPQAPSDNRQFVRAAAAAASSTSASRRTFTQPAELESAFR